MANSGESKTKVATEAGGLVWVRRRNGAWWPGQILSVDQVPQTCMPAKRLGTPVQLLGKADASMDWYNLEKSKRIKAFRCGEFDGFIERAKACRNSVSKIPMKYARREDAIIQALQLEDAQQSGDKLDFSTIDVPSVEEHEMVKLPSPLVPGEEIDRKVEGSSNLRGKLKLGHEMAELPSPLVPDEEINHNEMAELPSPLVPDEEINHKVEGSNNLRGKLNLGHELSHPSVSLEDPYSKEQFSQERKINSPGESEDDRTERVNCMRGVEDLCTRVASRRKKTVTARFHEILKKKPYASGVEDLGTGVSSKRKIILTARFHEFINKKTRRRQLKHVLGSTAMVTVPVMSQSLVSHTVSPILRVSGRKVSGLESKDSKRSFHRDMNNIPDSSDTSLSTSDHASGALLNNCKEKGFTSVHASGASQKLQVVIQGSQVEAQFLCPEDFIDCGPATVVLAFTTWNLKRKRNLRNPNKNRKHDFENSVDFDGKSDCYLAGLEPRDVGAELVTPPMLLPTLKPYVELYDPISNLFDVEVKVETSYRPQTVPYTCLSSKYDGQSIVGYPVDVEALDDNFIDDWISGSGSSIRSSGEGEDAHAFQNANKIYKGKLNPGGRTIYDKCGPYKPRAKPCELSKSARTWCGPKKLRRVSAPTASEQRCLPETNTEVENLTMPSLNCVPETNTEVESFTMPSVNCVPVNVIFRRLNAALNS